MVFKARFHRRRSNGQTVLKEGPAPKPGPGILPVVRHGDEGIDVHEGVGEGECLHGGAVIGLGAAAADPLPAGNPDDAGSGEIVDVELEDVLVDLIVGPVAHDLHGDLVVRTPEIVLEPFAGAGMLEADVVLESVLFE